MFTGLIEAIGTIRAIEESNGGKRFIVGVSDGSPIFEDLTIGDSIAVDGACMTVVARDAAGFQFEASPESLSLTTLGKAVNGTRVNLERPLTPSSRIGGHYVTGHVDGLARVVAREPEGNSIIFRFQVASDALAELLVPKGSVAVLGISLTVNTVDGRFFTVAIIPHTLTHTTLGDYQPGAPVNIETDLLGKYVRRLMPGYRDALAGSGMNAAVGLDQTSRDGSSARRSPVAPAVDWDDRALQPGTEAILTTQAFSRRETRPATGTQIRTGGWFNFQE